MQFYILKKKSNGLLVYEKESSQPVTVDDSCITQAIIIQFFVIFVTASHMLKTTLSYQHQIQAKLSNNCATYY